MLRRVLQRYGGVVSAATLRNLHGSSAPFTGMVLEPIPVEKKKKLGLSVIILFLPCVATFGLGSWQVMRREWKADLLEYKRKRLEQDPISVGEALNAEADEGAESPLEYRRVVCEGVFDEDKSIFIGPRMKAIRGASQKGYYILTPLYPVSESVSRVQPPVLVNRGWVPSAWRDDFVKGGVVTPKLDERFHQDKIRTGTWWKTWWKGTPTVEISPETNVKRTVRVCGVVRNGENPSMFVPLNEPENGQWFYTDVPAMVKATGMPENTPYVEAVAENSPEEDIISFPLPKELEDFVRTSLMPNDHLTYAFTWYTLSAATTYMAIQRIKEKPVIRKLR